MDRQPTILLADDDPDVVELMKVYLRPHGYAILTAKDGEEALAIARANLPDLVLLDVAMPKKSGWEVCQALKGVQRTSHIPIVLITGRGEVKDRLTGLQLGADDYLVKPFDRAQVLKRIPLLMEKAREQREGKLPPAPADLSTHELLHDRTTRLPTISLILERAKELLIDEGELGVLYTDIEQYDAIEEDHGWAFFDEFLRTVGEVINGEVQKRFGAETPMGVSRIGGSSFFVFFQTRSAAPREEDLETMAHEIRDQLIQSLRQRFPKMESGEIGFFVGAARIPYQPQIRLERQIYHGMRKAADAVRNAEQHRKKQLARELRDIIKRGRVSTLFQPIVHSSGLGMFGYEILTRGQGQSSFRNSDMLFEFAREINLAWDLQALALDSCLKRLRGTDLGDLKFLVNLEAEMFEEKDFRFHEMVSYFGEQRGHFVFELTERAAIQDYEHFRELLEGFRKKGIEIAIDDAGSGYASLEAIASLSPDYLKITKGLVSAVAQEPIKQDLLGMLVELAHKIGARTIAEGIETEEELHWCQELGIDLLQGYYIAMPTEELVTEVALAGGA